MRKIVSLAHVSLDGVMQAPGGPEEDSRDGFTLGGWAMPHGDETGRAALAAIMAGGFDLLLGRRTYEIFAAYWPYAGDHPIAQVFNRAAKHVVTRSLDRLDWENSHRLDGDAVAATRRLKETPGPDLHLWGSSELRQALHAADLIDEFRIWIYPVVLGRGRRLFSSGMPPRALTLVESQPTAKGVLLNTYRPAGALPPRAPDRSSPSAAERERRRKWADEKSRG